MEIHCPNAKMACAVYLPPAGDADCQTMALAPLSGKEVRACVIFD